MDKLLKLFGKLGTKSATGDDTPIDNTPVDNTPVDNTQGDNVPVNNTPINNIPQNTPQNTPVNNIPVDNTHQDISQDTHISTHVDIQVNTTDDGKSYVEGLTNGVGIVDDVRCDLHKQTHGHQESPNRTRAIREYLEDTGLYGKLTKIPPREFSINYLLLGENGKHSITPEQKVTIMNVCSDDPILRATHTQAHICNIVNACINYPHRDLGNDVSLTGPSSLLSTLVACGSVIAAVDVVLDSKMGVNNIFCNVRPPGHHCSADKPRGFCPFNNVAIGANYALTKSNIKKVLIFDWDLHVGDGTSEIFYDNPNVLWCSFHRGTDFYPSTGERSDTGKVNNIMNFPQPHGVSVDKYISQFDNEFMPRAIEFMPDLIFISCGFDSHKDDTYHELPLDYEHFNYMTGKLLDLANISCNGKLISVLEGGYNTNIISKCAYEHINTMLTHRTRY